MKKKSNALPLLSFIILLLAAAILQYFANKEIEDRDTKLEIIPFNITVEEDI